MTKATSRLTEVDFRQLGTSAVIMVLLNACSLERNAVGEVAEVEAGVGGFRRASAFLSPCVEHEGEVGAIDLAVSVDVGAAGEAVAAGGWGDLEPPIALAWSLRVATRAIPSEADSASF
jgi:hypothetical protein